jgi:hypothetical protein
MASTNPAQANPLAFLFGDEDETQLPKHKKAEEEGGGKEAGGGEEKENDEV